MISHSSLIAPSHLRTLVPSYLRTIVLLLLTAALTACQQEDDMSTTDPIPEGMGRVNVTIKAKRPAPATRAETGNWLDPVGDNELINYYWVVFVDGTNTVSEVVGKNWVGENHNVTTTGDTRPQGQGSRQPAERDEFSFDVAPGQYTVYGFANITDAEWTALGITKGSALPDLSQKTLTITNGWDKIIPMTSNIKGQRATTRASPSRWCAPWQSCSSTSPTTRDSRWTSWASSCSP